MKFSIITPTFNSEKYLAETIESVLTQAGDFEIEYIIMDGGSTDTTVRIAREYEEKIKDGGFPIGCKGITMSIFSGKDAGMYDAIDKGFDHATGDVHAWINSDDLYLPNAFANIAKVFKHFPDVLWLKGITSFLKENGERYQYGRAFIYEQKWIKKGIYGRNAYFIHQDSVFWKAMLWKKAGPIDAKLRYAGDYDLWIKFAHVARLWSLNREVSVFRKRTGQLSADMTAYRAEQASISQEKGFGTKCVKIFFWLQSKRPQWMQPLFVLIYRLAFWGTNSYFIDIGPDNIPTKKRSFSYIAPYKRS